MGDGPVALPANARTREHLDWIDDKTSETPGEASIRLAKPGSAVQKCELAGRMAGGRATQYAAIITEVDAAGATRGTRRATDEGSVARGPSGHPHRPGLLCLADPPVRARAVQVRHRARRGTGRRNRVRQAGSGSVAPHRSRRRSGCSVETIRRRSGVDAARADPVLWWLAQIAHETDMGDGRHDTQEAHGMDVVVRGLSIVCDDERMQKLTGTSCDGIHTYYHRAPLLGP